MFANAARLAVVLVLMSRVGIGQEVRSDGFPVGATALPAQLSLVEYVDLADLPGFQVGFSRMMDELQVVVRSGAGSDTLLADELTLRLALQRTEAQLHLRIDDFQSKALPLSEARELRAWLVANERRLIALAHQVGTTFPWEAESLGHLTVEGGKVVSHETH